MRRGLVIAAVLVLGGCGNGGPASVGGLFAGGDGPGSGGLFGRARNAGAPQTTDAPGVTETPVLGAAAAEDIAPADASARAEAVAAGNTAAGDAVRGFTVASLGDATIPGLWIETPLVDRERPATVVAPDGTTVAVIARPSGGARGSGSRLSLAAFQALGLDLTGLPTVTVIAE